MVFICRYVEFALLTHIFANLDLHVSDMGGFACTAAEEEDDGIQNFGPILHTSGPKLPF